MWRGSDESACGGQTAGLLQTVTVLSALPLEQCRIATWRECLEVEEWPVAAEALVLSVAGSRRVDAG